MGQYLIDNNVTSDNDFSNIQDLKVIDPHSL
jgi:hypothetical protein